MPIFPSRLSLVAFPLLFALATPGVCAARFHLPDLFSPPPFTAPQPAPEAVAEGRQKPKVADQLQRAVDEGLISGGVALTGNASGILSVTARGKLSSSDAAPLLDEGTIFDLASLTKVIATAPAVMKLVQDGKVSLSDPLVRWFPEFRGSRHAGITIGGLLTHTSGLEDLDLRHVRSIKGVIRKAAAERCTTLSGNCFSYADINFILLGELVRRASGKRLDDFCREEFYDPLGMKRTMFLPPPALDGMVAATAGFGAGVVSDTGARRLGSVAGHAGLFSSARDLSTYARLMLGGGALDGKRILTDSIVTQMTTPYVVGRGAVKRGLGWDIDSPFSAPKGELLSEDSFGHTGYSGSSIWIDRQSNLFVILLTIRRDYQDTASFNRLRRDISTLAAAEYGALDEKRKLLAETEVARIRVELESPPRPRPLLAIQKVVKHNPAPRHAKRAGKTKIRHAASATSYGKGNRYKRRGRV